MDKSKVLEEEKIPSLLWKFSVPAIVGTVVNALYHVIDSIFVGHGVGEIGLTAVTIAFPLMIILIAIGMLVGVGASTLVSIRLGEHKRDDAELILGNALTTIIIVVLISTTFALYYLDDLLIKLGATPEVLPYARDFMSIVLLGSVFMHVGFGLNGIIQAQGDPKTALATMLIAAILNTALNPLFIFVFQMGIKGSALATVTAQAVAAAWVLVYFLRGQGTLKLKMKNLTVRIAIIVGIVKTGSAPFLMQICTSAIMVLFNNTLFEYGGSSAVASFGIINRLFMLILMPVLGISQGAQPIIGYNYGAGKYQRVAQTLKIAMIAATSLCVVCFFLIQVFDEQIIRLFNGSAEMIRIGSNGLKLFLALLPIIGFQIIGANYFQAVGKAGHAILLNTLRQVILLIPLLFFLPRLFGLTGVWLAGPISDFGSAVLTAVFLFWERKKLVNKRIMSFHSEKYPAK